MKKKTLKGKDLEIGMRVVLIKLPKRINMRDKTISSYPFKVLAIDYPHVIFRYEKEVQTLPFLPSVVRSDALAFDVRGYRFQEVSQEYADTLTTATAQVEGEPSPWKEQEQES